MLGQNFSKMFGIQFEDRNKEKQFAWQTSWGFTTRSIGVFIMHHSDDKGVVLTPRVAIHQVVIVPIYMKKIPREEMNDECDKIAAILKKAGVRVKIDDRDNYTPGFRYNHWEIRGIPLRIELGPKDLEEKKVTLVQRYDGAKSEHPLEGLGEHVTKL